MSKKHDISKITDEEIHRMLVSMGFLFPETEDEVQMVMAQMEREGFDPELPESLKEPPLHLLKIVMEGQRKRRTTP